jgi:hypothetical protein
MVVVFLVRSSRNTGFRCRQRLDLKRSRIMTIQATISEGVLPDNVDLGAASVEIDSIRATKFRGTKHGRRHAANLYCGFFPEPVESPEKRRCFAAAVLKNVKTQKGKKRKIPIRISLFRTAREARETALVWACGLEEVEIGHVSPGKMTRQERQSLFAQLDESQSCNRSRINGPRLVLVVNQQEPTPNETSTVNTVAAAVEEHQGGTIDPHDMPAKTAEPVSGSVREDVQDQSEDLPVSRLLLMSRIVTALRKAATYIVERFILFSGPKPDSGSL